MRLLTTILISAALVAIPTTGEAYSKLHKPHFARGSGGSKELLAAIIQNAADRVGFNRYYLISTVSCGPGCDSYWFVDNRDSTVVAAPNNPGPGEVIYDMVAAPQTNRVTMVYGPSDGVGKKCTSQEYRMAGLTFKATTKRHKVICPS